MATNYKYVYPKVDGKRIYATDDWFQARLKTRKALDPSYVYIFVRIVDGVVCGYDSYDIITLSNGEVLEPHDLESDC